MDCEIVWWEKIVIAISFIVVFYGGIKIGRIQEKIEETDKE